MNEKHLTDADIQTLLDGGIADKKNFAFKHLTECQVCRKKYEAYQKLAVMLAAPPDIELAANFSQRVLQRPDFPISLNRRFFLPYILSSSGVLAACIGIFIYMGINPRDYFGSIFKLSFMESARSIMDTLSPILNQWFGIFQGRVDLILFSLLSLLIIALLDRFILRALTPDSNKPLPPSWLGLI